MNADDIVRKLKVIEKEAAPIWDAFNKHYSPGFFNKMIEREFGINPDTHEEIGNKFGQEVNNIRIMSNERFEKLLKETRIQMDKLSNDIKQKHVECMAVKEQKEDDIKKVKEEIYSIWEQHFIEMQAANYK